MSQSWTGALWQTLFLILIKSITFSVKDAAFEIDTPPYIEQVSVDGDQLLLFSKVAHGRIAQETPGGSCHSIEH